MRIDRCYCFDVTFEAMKKIAAAEGARSVVELQEHCEFGKRCTLCHPYVRKMLRTGTTVFDHVITEADESERTPSSPGK